jgi:ribosomal protein S27AE
MKIDFTKPLIDEGGSEKCMIRHLRFCENCGQRYAIYSNGDHLFQTYMTLFRNNIRCPSCGLFGTSAPYIEPKDYNQNQN